MPIVSFGYGNFTPQRGHAAGPTKELARNVVMAGATVIFCPETKTSKTSFADPPATARAVENIKISVDRCTHTKKFKYLEMDNGKNRKTRCCYDSNDDFICRTFECAQLMPGKDSNLILVVQSNYALLLDANNQNLQLRSPQHIQAGRFTSSVTTTSIIADRDYSAAVNMGSVLKYYLQTAGNRLPWNSSYQGYTPPVWIPNDL